MPMPTPPTPWRGGDFSTRRRASPFGVREYGARVLEGHLWYFPSPLD